MANLSVDLAGIKLKNPTILASGIMGVSTASLRSVIEHGAGAVTLKSIGPTPRTGHHNPTVYAWEQGIINAVGLSNPGVEKAVPMITETVKELDAPVIVSMFADTIDNFKRVAEQLMTTKPAALELNLSCPNTESDYGRMFALDTKMTSDLVGAVRSVIPADMPLFAKVSPDSPDNAEIGRAAEAAGADGIVATNTLSGMIIDIDARRPILTNKVGGIAGPAMKPVAMKVVWQLYSAVKIPIIGTGGVTTGRDVIEYIMAGATAVGVGAAIYYGGIDVFKTITAEIETFMTENKITSLEEIRGVAHQI